MPPEAAQDTQTLDGKADPGQGAASPAAQAGQGDATTSHWLVDALTDADTYESRGPDGKFAPAKLRDYPKLREFKTPAALAKSYVNLEKALGKKGLIKPDDNASDADKAAYLAALREHLGVPAKPEDYRLELPDGHTLDPKFAGWFTKTAHAAGLPPAAVQALAASFAKDFAPGYWSEFTKAQKDQAAQAIKEAFGKDYVARTEKAHRGFKAAAQAAGMTAEEAKAFVDAYGDDPRMLRVFEKIGETFTEDTINNGSTGPGQGDDAYVSAEKGYLKKFGVKE